MNKKLFIFMFLIMASPVFAVDNPFRDEFIEEQPPTLIEVKTTETVKETKTSLKDNKNFLTNTPAGRTQAEKFLKKELEKIISVSEETAEEIRNINIKFDFLNIIVRSTFPLFLVPFTVSISTIESSGFAAV